MNAGRWDKSSLVLVKEFTINIATKHACKSPQWQFIVGPGIERRLRNLKVSTIPHSCRITTISFHMTNESSFNYFLCTASKACRGAFTSITSRGTYMDFYIISNKKQFVANGQIDYTSYGICTWDPSLLSDVFK